MMLGFPKQFSKLLIALCILSVVLVVSFIVYQGRALASPQRRDLQGYHASWLDSPESHGVKIFQKLCCDKKVPTLIVEPSDSGSLGKRGKLIREQLQSKGFRVVQQGDVVANVVLLHGRNGRKEDLLPVAERFCAVGLRCIIPDLPAHGESPVSTIHFGQSDWEARLAHRVVVECQEEYKYPELPNAIWGMSMGGSFANHAASLGDSWTSITIVCSFDRLDRVVRNKCGSQLLTEAVSKACQIFGGVELSRVTPVEWVEAIDIPALVVHGDEDGLITLPQGKALFESFGSTEKRWITVKGGSHSNILTTPQPIYVEMAEWILGHLGE